MNETGMRLDEFLAYKMGRFSRSQANHCIKSGAVSIEPYRETKPGLRVRLGDRVSISQAMVGDVPQYDEVVPLFENDDFWCFDKPAGMTVHPTANIYHNTMTRYVEVVLGMKPYVVHRLDKETSGVLLMAKDPEVSRRLGEMFLTHSVQKQYEAIVYNAGCSYFPGSQRHIEIPLGLAGVVLPHMTMGAGHLPARTEVCCDNIFGHFARLKLGLHSGRQHQIRVHLALTGTPILGDKLYFFGEQFYKDYLDGKPVEKFSSHRHLLHARRIAFEWRGIPCVVEATTPMLFEEVFRGSCTAAMFPTPYAALYESD